MPLRASMSLLVCLDLEQAVLVEGLTAVRVGQAWVLQNLCYRAADQRLYFRVRDSTTLLLHENSRHILFSVPVQPGLCWTWSETPKTGFVFTRRYSQPLSTLLTETKISLIESETPQHRQSHITNYTIALKQLFYV